ncbi:MAG: hypothetical protein CMJ78_27315 [Planctomycetaceae bacterium]|nr:hypothetical protein [Planctomycetaceae bacterium]
MADILSQTEVEALLAALAPDINLSGDQQSARATSEQIEDVTAFDFRRPQYIRDELIRLCRPMSERFARLISDKLSPVLRAPFQAKLISIDQMSFSEFVANIESPSLICQLESAGLEAPIIADINLSICLPMVDRMMGGLGTPLDKSSRRALTDIEQTVMTRIANIIFEQLESAWEQLCPLELGAPDFESLPEAVHSILPSEAVVTFNFEWVLNEPRTPRINPGTLLSTESPQDKQPMAARGFATLCLPTDSLKPQLANLSSSRRNVYNADSNEAQLQVSIERARVEVAACLAETRLTAEDLVGLEIGDIIQTDCNVKQTVKLLVEGRAMFEASPGVVQGRKAAQIENLLAEPMVELLPND